MAGELQPDGSWLITDVAWPRSRMWEARWTPGRYGWQIGGTAASVIRPSTAFKINSSGA